MSASPAIISPATAYHSNQVRSRRRPFSLRRIEANRRNALRSSGPRTPEGKARVGNNAIKHGFFVASARWTPEQNRDLQDLHEQLHAEMQPLGRLEEYLIAEMALACAKTAMVLRYEGLAAIKFHRQREDQLNAQIAAADPIERARLEHQRDHLRRAGLSGPTIPGERDARAITRYGGSLDRRFHRALADFEALRDGRERLGAISKTQKQTHSGGAWHSATAPAACAALTRPALQSQFEERPDAPATLSRKRERGNAETDRPEEPHPQAKNAKTNPFEGSDTQAENAKTNPLNPAFAGNRHARRRAEALDRKRRSSHRTDLDG